jgi:hypothetical protein
LFVDGRIVGAITATAALILLGFVALGLFTSLPALLIAAGIAAVAGAAAGALAEPARSGRNGAVVDIAILILPICSWDKPQADMLHQDRVAARP